jgi:hypothetical protein
MQNLVWVETGNSDAGQWPSAKERNGARRLRRFNVCKVWGIRESSAGWTLKRPEVRAPLAPGQTASVFLGGEAAVVAQIFNLPYRRIAFCAAFTTVNDPFCTEALPIENRRYSRLPICATRATPPGAWALFGVFRGFT